jgi:hypothetical protein
MSVCTHEHLPDMLFSCSALRYGAIMSADDYGWRFVNSHEHSQTAAVLCLRFATLPVITKQMVHAVFVLMNICLTAVLFCSALANSASDVSRWLWRFCTRLNIYLTAVLLCSCASLWRQS